MASHEFRTPLTIIDAHAQRLIKMKEGLTPENIAERAGKIRNAVLRMTTVMDNLLTSSRLFDGDPGLYFHPTQIDLTKILHNVCQVQREIWSGIDLSEDFDHMPVKLIGDSNLHSQALGNLLSNAIKYSPNGEPINVRSAVELNQIVITITDQGIGIPKGDMVKLFERYHRGANVSTIAGTGIGLYLVKMVVTLHSGEVSASSVEGRGSKFIVKLPISGDRLVH